MSTPTPAPRAASGAADRPTPGRRPGVVDAAGEQDALAHRAGDPDASNVSIWASHRGKLDRGPTWPPHSRPSKTNRRAPLQETAEQPGRRDVQVGGDPRVLQRPGLRRPAAGDQGHRAAETRGRPPAAPRAARAGTKPEDADTGRAPARARATKKAVLRGADRHPLGATSTARIRSVESPVINASFARFDGRFRPIAKLPVFYNGRHRRLSRRDGRTWQSKLSPQPTPGSAA